MSLKAIFLILFNISLMPVYSQAIDSLDRVPEPYGGLNQLALTYYKIDFDKEQRAKLEGKELEFIYNIDTSGQATLEKVHGLDDEAIISILKATTKDKIRFYPKVDNGQKRESIYFIKIRFPSYQLTNVFHIYDMPVRPKIEDFEYIHTFGRSLDIVLGANANGFLGSVKDYLAFGGGMKLELMLMGAKGYGLGMTMNLYGNKLKKDFPINSNRVQNEAPPTILWGIGLAKSMNVQPRNKLILQCELNFVGQNITPSLSNTDKDWTQFKGLSLSIGAYYMIQIGKSSFYPYGTPYLTNHYISFHSAIRPLILNFKEANGILLDFGVSYRIAFDFVKDFKIKPDKLLNRS